MQRSTLLSIIFLVAAVISAVFGFAGLAPATALVGRVLLVVFAILFILFLVVAAVKRRNQTQTGR
jgi:uncharacterized membrane protein YtjA (UPF0391 family)